MVDPYLDGVPSFAASISVLALVQAVIVAAPRPQAFGWAQRLRRPAWAAVPAASLLVVVFGLRAAAGAAQSITYLALIAVPALALVALTYAARGARPWRGSLAFGLFALAWYDRTGLPGHTAALALSALSAVTLGALLAAIAPPRWLKAGIVLMAVLDTVLVASDLLQAPNAVLDAAAPAARLPALQDAVFGSAVMGYGDLFIAGMLGGLIAADGSGRRRASLLALVFALSFNLLFFFVSELPATVPIALTLIVNELWGRGRDTSL